MLAKALILENLLREKPGGDPRRVEVRGHEPGEALRVGRARDGKGHLRLPHRFPEVPETHPGGDAHDALRLVRGNVVLRLRVGNALPLRAAREAKLVEGHERANRLALHAAHRGGDVEGVAASDHPQRSRHRDQSRERGLVSRFFVAHRIDLDIPIPVDPLSPR